MARLVGECWLTVRWCGLESRVKKMVNRNNVDHIYTRPGLKGAGKSNQSIIITRSPVRNQRNDRKFASGERVL